MAKVTSKDGTQIAYETKGRGPALILVDGALCYRSFGPMQGLSDVLAPHFTTYIFDRRGRGESTNSKPYAVEREVEDIAALIEAAGGSASLYGISSGGSLSLEAAIRLGGKIQKLALYEAIFYTSREDQQRWIDYRKQLAELVSAGRRGDAVALFMQFVGTPAEQVDGMRHAPVWPMFEAVAPTLEYDAADVGKDGAPPLDRAAKVKASTLVMDGGANLTMLPFMHQTASALAKAIPGAQQRTLDGQTHDVKAEVIAPVLIEFFKS